MLRRYPSVYIPICAFVIFASSPFTAIAQDQTSAARTLELTSTSEEAQALFREGLNAWTSDLARADELMRRAVEADSSFGLARAFAAILSNTLGEDERMAEINRGVQDAASGSAGELLLAMGIRSMANDRMDEARSLFAALDGFSLDEPTVSYFTTVAIADPPERIAALRTLTQRHPNVAGFYNELGYELLWAGDRAGAEQAFQEQIRIAPDLANAHDSYAEFLQAGGNLAEAGEHYRHAIHIDPSFSASAIGLAELEQMQGNGDEARAILESTQAKETDILGRYQLMEALAGTYLYEGEVDEAVEVFENALQQAEAEEYAFYQNVANIHLALTDAAFGDGEKVHEYIAQARATGELGYYSFDHIRRVVAYAYAEAPDSARAIADAVMEAAKESGDAILLRIANLVEGWAHIAANDCEAASRAFAQADQDQGATQLGLAECAARSGDTSQAESAKERVLANTSNDYLFDYFPAIARYRLK